MESPLSAPADVETLSVRDEALQKALGLEAPVAASEPIEPPCPRCGGKLVNPQGLGWCPKCGYCRSLVEDAAKAMASDAPALNKPSPLGAREFYELLRRVPTWLQVLLAGVTVMTLVSLAARLLLRPDTLGRALFCTLELLFALVALILAQAWALIRIAPDEDSLGAKDIVLSVRLWSLTCRRLPEMRKQVWMGAWSATAGICAVFLVGGFSYWAQFYHPKKIAAKELLGAVKASEDGEEKSLEDSVKDFANSQDLTQQKEQDKDASKADTRPVVQCVVIGYTVEDKQLTGLVLATVDGNKLSYAGVVKTGFSEEQSKEILQQLATAVRPEPLIKSLKMTAIWVKPEVFCEVRQSGRDKDGLLINMNFAGLLEK